MSSRPIAMMRTLHQNEIAHCMTPADRTSTRLTVHVKGDLALHFRRCSRDSTRANKQAQGQAVPVRAIIGACRHIWGPDGSAEIDCPSYVGVLGGSRFVLP